MGSEGDRQVPEQAPPEAQTQAGRVTPTTGAGRSLQLKRALAGHSYEEQVAPKNDKVTEEDVKATQSNAAEAFAKIWDKRFKVTDTGNKTTYVVRAKLAFVTSGQHLEVTLHKGKGFANLKNWYTEPSSVITAAHELGHQLGLKDEYIAANVPDRKDASAPGVHKDNSIMGSFRREGVDKAEGKLRHGQTIAGHVGAATGRTLTTEINETK